MQKTDFMSLSFFAEKVILELKCTNHFFRASKNTNSVFSATKQINENAEATDAQKLFLSEKKLLNAILRAKLNTWKSFFLMKWTVFAMQKTAFHEFELFCRKSHFRA